MSRCAVCRCVGLESREVLTVAARMSTSAHPIITSTAIERLTAFRSLRPFSDQRLRIALSSMAGHSLLSRVTRPAANSQHVVQLAATARDPSNPAFSGRARLITNYQASAAEFQQYDRRRTNHSWDRRRPTLCAQRDCNLQIWNGARLQ